MLQFSAYTLMHPKRKLVTLACLPEEKRKLKIAFHHLRSHFATWNWDFEVDEARTSLLPRRANLIPFKLPFVNYTSRTSLQERDSNVIRNWEDDPLVSRFHPHFPFLLSRSTMKGCGVNGERFAIDMGMARWKQLVLLFQENCFSKRIAFFSIQW